MPSCCQQIDKASILFPAGLKNQFLPGKWDTLGAKEKFNDWNLTPVVAETRKKIHVVAGT